MVEIIAWPTSLESFNYGDYRGKLPIWLSCLLEHAGIFRLLPDGSVLYKNENTTLYFCDGGIDGSIDNTNIDANAKREIKDHCLPSLHNSFPQLKKPFTGRIVFQNRDQHRIKEVRIIEK